MSRYRKAMHLGFLLPLKQQTQPYYQPRPNLPSDSISPTAPNSFGKDEIPPINYDAMYTPGHTMDPWTGWGRIII
jgi:hypothetical protein